MSRPPKTRWQSSGVANWSIAAATEVPRKIVGPKRMNGEEETAQHKIFKYFTPR